MQEKESRLLPAIKRRVREHFRFATLDFIFIIAFVNVFQTLFGAENSIVGVIFTIMMAASMARDLTATPIRHLLIQALVLVLMASAACAVASFSPWAALPVNFVMVFFILYAFTYEYASHLYFPYILSYLFLVFIAPIPPDRLPKRLLGMLTGAVCIILYQLFMGRGRAVETARDALSEILDEALSCVDCLLTVQGMPDNPEKVRANLCRLSNLIYERRKRVLCISDASFAMLDAGRGLENLILLLYAMEGPVTPERGRLLREMEGHLRAFQDYVHRRTRSLPPLDRSGFSAETAETEEFYQALSYIRTHLLAMAAPEKRFHYRKTMLSFSVRLKAALDVSPVRLFYALRVSILLAGATLLVQLLGLPHGKWLLFTIASVSLPYADDVGLKARKRFVATVVGGIVGAVLYALVPSPIGRTAIMMLSGYLSFYFSDYQSTFACSTVGALGGAVFMSVFDWAGMGRMLLIRLGYIAAGIAVSLAANCLILPFRRERATKQLFEKYAATTALLTRICKEEAVDTQLYYSLVIQSHLMEEKLTQNASAEGWDGMRERLRACQRAVRAAHRRRGPAPNGA